MVLRGLAVRTRESYLAAVAGLARYTGKRPDRLTDSEVQAYLLYLIQERHLAWSSCNVAAQALRFFYHTTLGRSRTRFTIPAPKQPSKLPAIFSREEVSRLLLAPKSATGTKSRVFCGFRPGLSIPNWRKAVLAPAREERVNCSGFAQ